MAEEKEKVQFYTYEQIVAMIREAKKEGVGVLKLPGFEAAFMPNGEEAHDRTVRETQRPDREARPRNPCRECGYETGADWKQYCDDHYRPRGGGRRRYSRW